VLSLQGK